MQLASLYLSITSKISGSYFFFFYTYLGTFYVVAVLRIGVVLKLPFYSSHCVPLFHSCIYVFDHCFVSL